MRGLAARNGGQIGLAALVAILLLGVGLRVDNAWQGRAAVYDAQGYAGIAANLERGEGFTLGDRATQPASNYSPGLPLFVSGVYAVTGGVHERTARLVLALLGTLSVLFTYLIGRRLAGSLAGLVGAAAVAIYPALLEYQGMLMSEPLAATLLSGAVLAMLWAGGREEGRGSPGDRWVFRLGGGRLSEVVGGAKNGTPRPPGDPRPSSVGWLVPGLLLGALALVRPEYLAISLPIAVVVFARRGRDDWRVGLVQALVMLVGMAVVVAPWTVRNEVALGRFVPISTGGGQVLFAGSYVPSGGDPERVGAEVLERHPELRRELATNPRLEEILAALAAQRYPDIESDAALARMGRERLWDDVSEHPLEYAGFVASKLWLIWGHGPRDVMREPVWEVLHWLLVALGLLGLGVLAWQRRWEALLLGVVLVAVTATGALLVASPRRALVTIPVVAALAGVATTWAVRTCTGLRKSA
ncbi:MAG TPA: glycosyltransferase family 39 protein [Solirubrobacterales bacterium]|nr:glycosyltransferase family 39 protein [Solirubrobacterales bacterium]